MQPLGKVSIPVNFVEQVTEEVTRIIVANAEVLARQCAEACIRQVLSSSTPVPTLDLEKRTSVDDDPKTLMEVDVLAHQETEAWQSPQGSDLGSDLLQELLPTGSKGRGKGPAGRRPPPKAPGAKASPPTVCRRDSGMSELLQRVAEEGRRKDREESKEIEDLDLSQISPDCPLSRTICQRCEQEIPSEHFESHLTSHSSEILPWLYVGGKRNLDNEKELTVRTGITHVLNLAQEVNIKEDVSKLVTEYNGQRGLGFVYKKIGFGDTPDQDILEEMDGALEFIHDARCSGDQHRVLVNCVQGVSRSAAVVLAYLMKFERRSLQEAYDFLRRQRPIADPRQEFLEQLGRLECQLFGKPTPSLQAEEVFAGRRMLNVDGAPSPVMQEPGHSPEMMHELEALQQVMQSLNSQLQLIGAEADAAAKEVAHHNVDSADGGGGHMAESPRRDENQTAFVARRYVSKLTLPPKQMDGKSLPELKRERDACEALLDFMARTAAALLDQRDHLREQLPTQGTLASEGTPSEEGLRRPIV